MSSVHDAISAHPDMFYAAGKDRDLSAPAEIEARQSLIRSTLARVHPWNRLREDLVRDLTLIPFICYEELWPTTRPGDIVMFDPSIVPVAGAAVMFVSVYEAEQKEPKPIITLGFVTDVDGTLCLWDKYDDTFKPLDTYEVIGVCTVFMILKETGWSKTSAHFEGPKQPLFFPGLYSPSVEEKHSLQRREQ